MTSRDTQNKIRKQGRYEWVDLAKGFCSFAVVGMWVSGTMRLVDPAHATGWLGYFVSFAHPFRMPDFFLISGLFLSRVIDRPWKNYIDTKVVHYLYFFILWTLLTVPITWLLGHKPPGSVGEGIGILFNDIVVHPFQMLWFIMFLPIYFVATRLLKKVPAWIVLPAALVLTLNPLTTGVYHIDRFGVFFCFFYAGHALSSRFFALADWAVEHRTLVLALTPVWALFNAAVIKLGWADEHRLVLIALGFLGISVVVMLCGIFAHHPWTRGLRYLGENSIIVYLTFYLPMIVLVPALKASPIGAYHGTVATITLAGSIAFSLLCGYVARRAGLSFLYERPAWAKIVPPKASSDTGGTASQSNAKLSQC